MASNTPDPSPVNLTREDVVAVVGDADPLIVSRILSSGVSQDDVIAAQAWLASGGESVPPDDATRERVRALVELIATARTFAGR